MPPDERTEVGDAPEDLQEPSKEPVIETKTESEETSAKGSDAPTRANSGNTSNDIHQRTNIIDKRNSSDMKDKILYRSQSQNSVADTYSESNSEIVLRPHNQHRKRIVSAVVAPRPFSLEGRKNHSSADLQNLAYQKRIPPGKGKNENMVLQLVLPCGNQNSNHENNNYLTASSIDDILGNGQQLKERRPPSLAGQQELYHPNGNGAFINRAYSGCDLSSYGQCGHPMGASTPRTPITPAPSLYVDRPTSPEEKKRGFIDLLTKVLSGFYALFIITLGISVYVTDIADGEHPIAEIYSLILVVIAFMYILYLTLDISFYVRKKRQYDKLLERNVAEEIEMKETSDGQFHFNIILPEAVTLRKPLKHHYCFNMDRHSTNFYLKIGAAVFCFGHLIHSGLLIGYQIVFLTSDEQELYNCVSIFTVVLDFVYPMYSFLLLFFIFKYSNVIINRNVALARFGMMHCLSSSLCFWVWTIFREIVEALANKDDYDTNSTTIDPEDITEPTFIFQPYALPLTSYNQKGAQILTDYVEATVRRFTVVCEHDQAMKTIYKDVSPYLYPFSVEYSILVVGVLYLVWANIAMCCKETDEDNSHDDHDSTRRCKNPSTSGIDNTESNVVVHVDCHSSNKGLFGGFAVLVLTLVSTILFFISIYINTGERGDTGVMINIVTAVVILTFMTIACIFGYRQITKLDFNTAHHMLLDDILLFICIPAYYLNGIFSIIPAIIYANVLGIISICLEVFQVLIQTLFILDGLRRSSDTRVLRKKKPGRELVTFLVVCNIALWIFQTFEVKSHGMQDNRYEYYGKELWTILGHMCLPLMMFFRFHASVCFGDIWKHAYEPSGH